MIFSWLLCLLISIQAEIPYKPKEEFDVKLNYSFKQRSSDDHNTFRYDVQEKDNNNNNQNKWWAAITTNM